MNIVIFHKLIKFRIVLKKSISNLPNITEVFDFGRIESIKNLQSFKKINTIILDTETAFQNINYFQKLNENSNNPINYIIIQLGDPKETFLDKKLKNSTILKVDPKIELTTESLILEIRKHIDSALKKIQRKIESRINKSKVNRISKSQTSVNYKAILIGISTGGPKALRKLLPELTSVTNLPIIIVQHILKSYTDAFVFTLNSIISKEVIKAQNNQIIQNNKIYIAPGGIHLEVAKLNNNNVLKLVDKPPEENVKPSVNYLFRSAAKIYSNETIALVLTGMGKDGTDGSSYLAKQGAYIIAQDEKSSEIWSMPQNAISEGYVNKVLPISKISQHIGMLIR